MTSANMKLRIWGFLGLSSHVHLSSIYTLWYRCFSCFVIVAELDGVHSASTPQVDNNSLEISCPCISVHRVPEHANLNT